LVKINCGEKEAQRAQEHFVRTIQKGEAPEDVIEIQLAVGIKLLQVLVDEKMAESGGDAKRKIKQGGVKLDDIVVNNLQKEIAAEDNGRILKVGKRDFRKILVK